LLKFLRLVEEKHLFFLFLFGLILLLSCGYLLRMELLILRGGRVPRRFKILSEVRTDYKIIISAADSFLPQDR
jgi:hypothetical protein